MLSSIVFLPLLHALALRVEPVVLPLHVHALEFVNVLDEDTNQKLGQVCIFVHWFGMLGSLLDCIRR